MSSGSLFGVRVAKSGGRRAVLACLALAVVVGLVPPVASAGAQVIATPRVEPVAPSGLSASSTDVSVTVSWVVPAQPAGVLQDEMFLERVADDGDGDVVVSSVAVADDWDLSAESSWSERVGGLEADTEYRFRVRLATTGHGDVYSNVIAVSTQSEPPVAPSGLAAAVGDDGQVSLSWTIPAQPEWVDDIGTMLVERRDSYSFGRVGDVDWVSGTTAYSFSDGTAGRGLPYEYRVRLMAGGRWLYSGIVEVTVPALVESGAGPLAGFSLIDASDQSLLGAVVDGETLVLSDPGAGDFTVRADIADGESVGSVFFELTGPVTATRTESWAPFALHGDNGSDDLYGGGPLPAGDYTLTATAYSSKHRLGDTLGTLAVSFTIAAAPGPGQVDPQQIAPGLLTRIDDPGDGTAGPLAGLRLVDAADQTAVAALADGDSVALVDPDGGSFALVADVAEGETVGSVSLELSGAAAYGPNTENLAPYSLHGDNNNPDDLQLRGQALPEGDYTLTATAYAKPGLAGVNLGTLEVSFAVTDGAKPSNLRLERLHNAFLVSFDRPITGDVDHFLIEWRELDEDYSSDRSTTVTGTRKTVKGLQNGTEYMVRVSPVDSDGAVHAGVEGSGQPQHFRDYIEEHFIDPNVAAFPWLQEAWYDEPIEIDLKEDDWGAWGVYSPQWRIALTFWSYRNAGFVFHELAHHYSMTNDIHLGNVEGRLAVLSGWLYLAEGGTRNQPHEAYADALNVRVTAPNRYKSGSTMDQVMHHAGQGTVPQWFYDTYSSDGTLDGVDHDLLWADMRKLRCLKGGDCHFLGGSVADHARGLFGGLCSMDETRSVLWGDTDYHSPWVDGGCNNRRPQELFATLIAGPDGDDETDDAELDVSWSVPLYTTTPNIDRYVIQWKSGEQSYDTTRQEIVTDLARFAHGTDISHTVTGLSPDTAYTVRVAAVNSADTADFTDDDGHTRTAETTAVEGERVAESNTEPDPWATLRAEAQTYDSFGGTWRMTRAFGYYSVADPEIVDGKVVGEATPLAQATYLKFDLTETKSVRLSASTHVHPRDVFLILEDSDGNEIAVAEEPNSTQQILLAVLGAGTYYVRIELADGDDQCLEEDYYRANSEACKWTWAFASKRLSEPASDDVSAVDYDVPDSRIAAVAPPDSGGDSGFSPIKSVFTLDEAELTWDAPDVDNVTEWLLQRSTDGAPWIDLHRSSEEFTSYNDRTVQPHRVYYYRLQLTVSGGTTLTSPPSVATNPEYITVGETYISQIAADSVTVAWNPVADLDTIDGYHIYNTYQYCCTHVATVDRDATEYTHTVPRSPYFYAYIVIPYSSRGTGLWPEHRAGAFVAPLSDNRFADQGWYDDTEAAPNTMDKLTFWHTSAGDVGLYWQGPQGPAPDGYEIRRINWSGATRHVDVMYVDGAHTDTFVDRTFRRGSVSYEVRAVNEHGASAWIQSKYPGSLSVNQDGSMR